jgi:hypothetical protein
MVVGQTQCYMLALVIAAAVGAHRGWGREVITCAILLGTVLFLFNGGIDFLLGGLGNLTRGTTAGIAAGDPTTCSPATKQTITTGVFGLLTYLGYRAGSRYGSPAQHSGHRIAGIIPGALNGAAIAYYFTNALVPNGRQLTLFAPTGETTTAYLPEVFGLGLIGLVIVLMVAGASGKDSKSG